MAVLISAEVLMVTAETIDICKWTYIHRNSWTCINHINRDIEGSTVLLYSTIWPETWDRNRRLVLLEFCIRAYIRWSIRSLPQRQPEPKSPDCSYYFCLWIPSSSNDSFLFPFIILQVDLCLAGAEGVMENGGIINKVTISNVRHGAFLIRFEALLIFKNRSVLKIILSWHLVPHLFSPFFHLFFTFFFFPLPYFFIFPSFFPSFSRVSAGHVSDRDGCKSVKKTLLRRCWIV